MNDDHETTRGKCGFTPCERDVHDLIRKAEAHQLGTEFLKTGALDSVAAMFEVHAFVVDAARRKLNGGASKGPDLEVMARHAGAHISA